MRALPGMAHAQQRQQQLHGGGHSPRHTPTTPPPAHTQWAWPLHQPLLHGHPPLTPHPATPPTPPTAFTHASFSCPVENQHRHLTTSHFLHPLGVCDTPWGWRMGWGQRAGPGPGVCSWQLEMLVSYMMKNLTGYLLPVTLCGMTSPIVTTELLRLAIIMLPCT